MAAQGRREPLLTYMTAQKENVFFLMEKILEKNKLQKG